MVKANHALSNSALFAINAFNRFANVLGQFLNFFRLISLGLKERSTMYIHMCIERFRVMTKRTSYTHV